MAAAALPLALGLGAGPAAGDDSPAHLRLQAQNLARQVASQGERISVLAEQYDGAVLAQEDADRRLVELQHRVDEAATRARSVDGALRGAAVTAYVRGPGPAPVLTAKADPDQLAVANQYVRVGLAQQRGLLQQARSFHDELDHQRAQAAEGAQLAADATRRVAIDKASAESAAAAQEKLLAKVEDQLPGGAAPPGTPDPVPATASVDVPAALPAGVDTAAAAGAGDAARPARPAAATSDPGPAPAAPRTTRVAQPGPAPARPTTTLATPTTGRGPAPTPAPATTRPPAPTTAHSTSPPTTAKPPAVTSNPPPARGAAVAVSTAKAQLGKPYLWGGAGPDSFDCSGLTSFAWRAAGVSLPHSSAAQYSSLPHVSLSGLQPGDLLFFGSPIHHVGLYVGSGEMIEAPYTGANVRYGSISRSDYVGAARP